MLRGSAHSSGHITLLFTVEDDDSNPLNQGSRGAGLCIDTENPCCQVEAEGVSGTGRVLVNPDSDDTGLHAVVINEISKLDGKVLEYDWRFEQCCSLPSQQGFGLSAAGALASCHAVGRALGYDEHTAAALSIHVAHLVERRTSGGLGDVSGLFAGGVELRRIAGCPKLAENLGANGNSEGWREEIPVLLAWLDEPAKHTSEYIDDTTWKQQIREAGEHTLAPLLEGEWNSEKWPSLLTSANKFAEMSGLLSDSGRFELLTVAESIIADSIPTLSAHLCMLGQSIAILPRSLDHLPDQNLLSSLAGKLQLAGLMTAQARVSSSRYLT